MQIPSFDELARERNECIEKGYLRKGFASGMHPNPKFYKYRWWIFWKDSPVDGREFLTDQYALSTAAAIELEDILQDAQEPYWIYNSHRPRFDPENTPFDPNSSKWKNAVWAPAYDDDTDPIVMEGNIKGHR